MQKSALSSLSLVYYTSLQISYTLLSVETPTSKMFKVREYNRGVLDEAGWTPTDSCQTYKFLLVLDFS